MNDNNQEKVILFPDCVLLQKEIQQLRTEVSLLLSEKDTLLLVECKNLETAYMLALGDLEYKVYKLHCNSLRLKRKIELIQAKKNRQEKLVLSSIEDVLNQEFALYQKKLEAQMNQMNNALKRSQCDILSDEETATLKKLYRGIVKAIHPDLNPNITPAQTALFHNAVHAYENGDLNTIEIISSMVTEAILPATDLSELTVLNNEKSRLQRLILSLLESIDAIQSRAPYTLKAIIQDQSKVEHKKEELKKIILQLNQMIEFYKNKIEEMLR